MMTHVHTTGLENSHLIERLLDDGQRLSHLDIDVLVLGSLARPRASLLNQLRYRKERRAPYAILPQEMLIPGLLKVPYITYGYTPEAHVYALENSIHTPLGEIDLEPREEMLAAVALGLALRLPPEVLFERLNPTQDLPLAA